MEYNQINGTDGSLAFERVRKLGSVSRLQFGFLFIRVRSIDKTDGRLAFNQARKLGSVSHLLIIALCC